MTRFDYTKIDEFIAAELSSGPKTLDELTTESFSSSVEFPPKPKQHRLLTLTDRLHRYNVLSRRLQALKRDGRVRFATKRGWSQRGSR